jgi:hypothetical protein
VLQTKLGLLAYTDRHALSIILPQPPDRPDLRRTNWSKFQACLEAGLPPKPDLPNEVPIDACVKELSSTISKELAESTPKCRPRDPRPRLAPRIQSEIRLQTRLRRQLQITRDPALKAEVNRLQRLVTYQLSKWRNDQWSDTLENLDSKE